MTGENRDFNLRDGQVLSRVGPQQFDILSRLHEIKPGQLAAARRILLDLSLSRKIIGANEFRSLMSGVRHKIEEVDWVVLNIVAGTRRESAKKALDSRYYGFSPRSELEVFGITEEASKNAELKLFWDPNLVRPFVEEEDLHNFNTKFGTGENEPMWSKSMFASHIQTLEERLANCSPDMRLDVSSAAKIIADEIGLINGMSKVVERVISPLDIEVTRDNLPGLLLYYLNYRRLILEGKMEHTTRENYKIFPELQRNPSIVNELDIITKYFPSLKLREQNSKD